MDVTEREPERFDRAVRAGCDAISTGKNVEDTIRAAILAWEAPQRLGDEKEKPNDWRAGRTRSGDMM